MMSDRVRQGMVYLIAVAMVAAVASAPTLAQTADPNAERVFEIAGLNSDKVDGQHAIRYTTNKYKRAGKLVATNSNGFLPSNILKPQWRVIQNMPKGFADGVDNVGASGWTSYVEHSTYSIGDTPESILVSMGPSFDSEIHILPIGDGDEVIVLEETYQRISNGWIRHYFRVKRHPNSPSATVQFKLRVRVFDTGFTPAATTPAALRKAVRDQIVVKMVKRRS